MWYEVDDYTTVDGKRPFTEWLVDLRDGMARAKLTTRVERMRQGDFGDWKAVTEAKGIFEMREHYGPGYRIFFSIVGQKVVVLLAGSSKKDQDRTIAKAKQYLADYHRRNKP